MEDPRTKDKNGQIGQEDIELKAKQDKQADEDQYLAAVGITGKWQLRKHLSQ